MAMYITRKGEFSASHTLRIPGLDERENRDLFGEEANPNGHGHNYIVEVTVEGEPDSVTGMVVDLKHVKDVLEREVLEPMDHRFLNFEVAPFDKVVPTTENLAREIWRRLFPHLTKNGTRLARVRLHETAETYVDIEEGA